MDQVRLTWDEIKKRYPSQYVGLVDVIFKNDDGVSIESGIVKYTSNDISEDELLDMAIKHEIVRRYTTISDDLQIGVLFV